MKIIVAADKNWGIGKDNKLLVSIPADMKMFRQETTGKVCVMGRKTLESFPGGLPLKNRTNIVLTRNENYKVKDAIIVHSIEELMEELKKYYNPDTRSDPAPFLPQCPQYESHIQRTGYPRLLEALLL